MNEAKLYPRISGDLSIANVEAHFAGSDSHYGTCDDSTLISLSSGPLESNSAYRISCAVVLLLVASLLP